MKIYINITRKISSKVDDLRLATFHYFPHINGSTINQKIEMIVTVTLKLMVIWSLGHLKICKAQTMRRDPRNVNLLTTYVRTVRKEKLLPFVELVVKAIDKQVMSTTDQIYMPTIVLVSYKLVKAPKKLFVEGKSMIYISQTIECENTMNDVWSQLRQ